MHIYSAPRFFNNSTCSDFLTILTNGIPSSLQIFTSIWPRFDAAAVCTRAVWFSIFIVSTNERAVKGFTKEDAAGTPRPKIDRESQEEYWRSIRYDWLERCTERQIVTAHHLDDCVETWVMSSMHGTGKIIPHSRNDRVLRPFRMTRKRDLELWANLKNVPYITDDSNDDVKYTRNYIRHEMMPHVLRVNPGIHKMLKKKMIAEVIE